MSTEYTTYIVDHCENVRKAYDWLLEHKIIESNKFETYIMHHDVSKYSEAEYAAYDAYFYGKSKSKEVQDAFDLAWLHHIHNNPHHWQHWVLINDDDGTKALEMPEEFVIEMFCDHWAFSHKSGNLKEIFDWYKDHKLNMIMHRNTKVMYEALLNQVKEALKHEDNL
jgi:hypothetical protein